MAKMTFRDAEKIHSDDGAAPGEQPPTAPKTKDDAVARNEQDQRAAKEAPKPTTHGLPSAPADVKPVAAPAHEPVHEEPERLPSAQDQRDMTAASKRMHANLKATTTEPDGPMSLADVNAILADDYPGFEPTNVRGESAGLKFALPGGGSITVERARIKKCANMEELRAYIDSVK